MRQQPISVHVHVHIKVQSLFPTVRTLRSKLNTRTTKKMSGTSDESETNLELLSKDDKIVDKKGSANSVIWKWFGYLKSDEAQIKTICKICRWFVKTKTGNTRAVTVADFYHRGGNGPTTAGGAVLCIFYI